jgi:hypothetical protein
MLVELSVLGDGVVSVGSCVGAWLGKGSIPLSLREGISVLSLSVAPGRKLLPRSK